MYISTWVRIYGRGVAIFAKNDIQFKSSDLKKCCIEKNIVIWAISYEINNITIHFINTNRSSSGNSRDFFIALHEIQKSKVNPK